MKRFHPVGLQAFTHEYVRSQSHSWKCTPLGIFSHQAFMTFGLQATWPACAWTWKPKGYGGNLGARHTQGFHVNHGGWIPSQVHPVYTTLARLPPAPSCPCAMFPNFLASSFSLRRRAYKASRECPGETIGVQREVWQAQL